MGPRSTAPFVDMVVTECQQKYGARRDIDIFTHDVRGNGLGKWLMGSQRTPDESSASWIASQRTTTDRSASSRLWESSRMGGAW
jgi:hypothetical protein